MPDAPPSDLKGLEQLSNRVHTFSIQMAGRNMITGMEAQQVDGLIKIANAFMSQPGKVQTPQ